MRTSVSLGVGHRLPAGGGVQLQMKPILHWHNKALVCEEPRGQSSVRQQDSVPTSFNSLHLLGIVHLRDLVNWAGLTRHQCMRL